MSKSAAVFNKKKFINDVTETVRHMYRKQLEEASQQEIFQAVSYVVKDVVIDDWLATQQAFDESGSKDCLLYVNGISDGPCAWTIT